MSGAAKLGLLMNELDDKGSTNFAELMGHLGEAGGGKFGRMLGSMTADAVRNFGRNLNAMNSAQIKLIADAIRVGNPALYAPAKTGCALLLGLLAAGIAACCAIVLLG